jgi:hypothetical protein
MLSLRFGKDFLLKDRPKVKILLFAFGPIKTSFALLNALKLLKIMLKCQLFKRMLSMR